MRRTMPGCRCWAARRRGWPDGGAAARHPRAARAAVVAAGAGLATGNRAPLVLGNHFNSWNANGYTEALAAFVKETCRRHGILPYLGGSCNETDISVRASVHVGIALGAWRMFTRPGLGFDEGIMVVTNEINRTKAML